MVNNYLDEFYLTLLNLIYLVNKNKGMEIGLRLRTDRLDGLRPFDTIMRTLLHELTHMVHDDHDIAFRELNPQLTKARCQRDWTRSGGGVATEGGGPSEVWETEEEAGALFAGGVGEAGGALPPQGADARAMALSAARRRAR